MKAMKYKDMTPYRIGYPEDRKVEFFPETRSVGWLGEELDFEPSLMDTRDVALLQRLTFHSEIKGRTSLPVVEGMYTRGFYQCRLCPERRLVEYMWDESIATAHEPRPRVKTRMLGNAELCIPDVAGDVLFAVPNLLIHYVTEHHYLPPKKFIDALREFDFQGDFDERKKRGGRVVRDKWENEGLH